MNLRTLEIISTVLPLAIDTAPTTFYTFFYKNLKKIISEMVIRILVSISEFVFFLRKYFFLFVVYGLGGYPNNETLVV